MTATIERERERRVMVTGDGSLITDRSSDKPPPALSTSGQAGPVPPSAVGEQ